VTDTAVGFIDVYKEFDEVIADKYKIMNFKSLVRILFKYVILI